MQTDPIPGNPLSEVQAARDLDTDYLRDRLNLLIGGQHSRRRSEPRYLAEVNRLKAILAQRETEAARQAEEPPTASADATRLVFFHAQLGPHVDQAVAALDGFTGYEDNLRGQATEILLGMVPQPVEAAFTALMERAERWNEEN